MDDEMQMFIPQMGFGVVKHNNTCEYSDHFPSGFCKKTSRNNTHIGSLYGISTYIYHALILWDRDLN